MYFVYILYSVNHDRFYTGFTEDIDRRLKEHNRGKTKSTKAFKPWKVVYSEKLESRIEAREREKYFKSGSGREFIKSKMAM